MVSARVRLLATAALLAGAGLMSHPGVLLAGWAGILVPIAVIARRTGQHLLFLLGAFAPIAGILLVLWGVWIGAPPGQPVGSDPSGGLLYASLISSRLLFIGGTLQLSFITIEREHLAATLARWGMKGDALIIVLSAVTLVSEARQRAGQVVAARKARGLHTPTVLGHARHLASLLVPIFVWCLRSATQRATNWHQRRLIEKAGTGADSTERYSATANSSLMTCSLAWLMLAVFLRWRT